MKTLIKEVYLANTKIEVSGKTVIKDDLWRSKLVEDGLYEIAVANDLLVYKLGNYLFDVEKERVTHKFSLKFRERLDGKKNQQAGRTNEN